MAESCEGGAYQRRNHGVQTVVDQERAQLCLRLIPGVGRLSSRNPTAPVNHLINDREGAAGNAPGGPNTSAAVLTVSQTPLPSLFADPALRLGRRDRTDELSLQRCISRQSQANRISHYTEAAAALAGHAPPAFADRIARPSRLANSGPGRRRSPVWQASASSAGMPSRRTCAAATTRSAPTCRHRCWCWWTEDLPLPSPVFVTYVFSRRIVGGAPPHGCRPSRRSPRPRRLGVESSTSSTRLLHRCAHIYPSVADRSIA
jgi:hypothetical protein